MFAHEILFQPKNPCFPDMFRGAGSVCESPHARVWRSPKQELASPIKMQRSIREPPVACFRDAATPANGRLLHGGNGGVPTFEGANWREELEKVDLVT